MRHPRYGRASITAAAYAADLWVMDVAAKTYTRLSGQDDYKGNWLWPMYGNRGEIYFVSDRTANEKNIQFGGPEVMKSVNNIWKISDRGGKPVPVTHHADGNLYFPSISADGKVIVYEDNFGLWKLDTASGKSTEIRIDIRSDPKENDTELVTINNEAEGFHLSPSNRRAAIVAHGEIFTIATGRGEPQRVSETPWREQDPRWSPDGKWIAFVSDRTGRQEVWIGDELGKTAEAVERRRLRQVGPGVGPRFEVPAVDRFRSQAAARGNRERQNGRGGLRGCRQCRKPRVFARWQVDLLFQAGSPAAHARLCEEPGGRPGAHDFLRPVPDFARRAVDARRQEAGVHRRREPSGDGLAGLPRHAQPDLFPIARAHRKGAGRSRDRHRGGRHGSPQ